MGHLSDLVYMVNPVKFARERLEFDPDVRQAEVLGRRVRRALLNCTRQWGKSTITAAKAVHRAYFEPESLTVVLSPSARQSAEFLRKASGFARKLEIRPRGDGDNEISLLFPNGARIVGLPGSESTVRGFSAVSLMIIDEAARVSDELYKTLRPMTAVSSGDMLLMSTPSGQRGFFYEAWVSRTEEWERISVPATECERIPKEFLEEERAVMGDWWFRQEYLCEFVDTEDCLFSRELIEAALSDEVEPLFRQER
jgi:Terminase large subunit, T4likevirus-type, N-terminal